MAVAGHAHTQCGPPAGPGRLGSAAGARRCKPTCGSLNVNAACPSTSSISVVWAAAGTRIVCPAWYDALRARFSDCRKAEGGKIGRCRCGMVMVQGSFQVASGERQADGTANFCLLFALPAAHTYLLHLQPPHARAAQEEAPDLRRYGSGGFWVCMLCPRPQSWLHCTHADQGTLFQG